MPRPQRSRRRRIAFLLASILLPFVVLAGSELVLRLCGRGGSSHAFVELGPSDRGTVIVTDPAGAISYFFTDPKRGGSLEQSALLTPKPRGTIRIMMCGESAAKGFPQPPAFASSAFL